MSIADDKIEDFETTLLLPALREVCGSKALQREFTCSLIVAQVAPVPELDELLQTLAASAGRGRRCGPSLAVENRERLAALPPLAGRYVMTTLYAIHNDEVYASPAVLFWMRFNVRLHAFNHRYDNGVERHRLEDVTRSQILDHIVNSFDFYKLHALSSEPFPGYR